MRIRALLAPCAALLVAVAPAAVAGPMPAAARAEVETLLARLQSSGCAFARNGTWHEAAEAKAHLLRKLRYLEDRDAAQTAEEFIARAATGSSASGRPYLVKCGDAAPVESAAWLATQLRTLRARTGR